MLLSNPRAAARALRQWLALPARTRALIARHPHLLIAFERWHRYHTDNLTTPRETAMSTPAKHDVETPPFWARFKASRFYDPISRAYHSFAQEFATRALPILATLAVAGGVASAGHGFLAALVSGGGAAVSSLLLSAATLRVPALSVPLDTAIRLLRTAVSSVAGLFAASLLVDDQSLVTFGWASAIYGAVLTAVMSLVKTYLVNGAAGGNDLIQGRIDAQRDVAVPKA